MKHKDLKFIGASVVFGFLSAGCCILPLIAALFGLSFLSVLAIKIENFRWVFIGLAILFVGISGYWLYREKKRCNCLSKKSLVMFIFSVISVLTLILFPYILTQLLSVSC